MSYRKHIQTGGELVFHTRPWRVPEPVEIRLSSFSHIPRNIVLAVGTPESEPLGETRLESSLWQFGIGNSPLRQSERIDCVLALLERELAMCC